MPAKTSKADDQKPKGPIQASASGPAASPSNSLLPNLLAAALIIILTFVAYQPAIKGGFIWDDEDILTDNPLIKSGLSDIWFSTKFYDYYPLTLTSLWVEWRLWPILNMSPMNPTGYHVINILLHAVTAVLFWRVFLRLKIPGAWFAGFFFALHPVCVESAAWIAERKNTLPMVFYALSILWYLRSERLTADRVEENGTRMNGTRVTRPSDGIRPSGGAMNAAADVRRVLNEENVSPPPHVGSYEGHGKWFWLSVAAFLLALLSKTSVVMLPFVLLGCAWWQRGKITRTDLVRSIPFFLLSLILGLVTVWVQYHRAISTDVDVVQTGSFLTRLARAGWAVWFYLYKALVPLKLSFVYPRWEVNPHSFVSYLPGLALMGCVALCWRFRQSWGKPLLFALGYFVVTLFPVLGFFSIYFQKYSFVADHWQYTSIIGLIGLVAGVGGYLHRKFPALAFVGIGLAAALGAGTWRQCLIYKNEEAIWRDTITKNPKAAIAYQNLGVASMQRGEFDQAMAYYQGALAAKPDHEGAHYGLATCLAIQGKVEEAYPHFREAVRLKPDFEGALNSLAWLLSTHPNPALRDGPQAVQMARRAVELTQGSNATYLDTLAAAHAEAKEFNEAVKVAEKAAEVAAATGHEEMVPEIRARAKLYRGRRPYRERM